MEKPVMLPEKYERTDWPSLTRPDLKPPDRWSLSPIKSIECTREYRLSSGGKSFACIKDGETLSDVFTMPAAIGTCWCESCRKQLPA